MPTNLRTAYTLDENEHGQRLQHSWRQASLVVLCSAQIRHSPGPGPSRTLLREYPTGLQFASNAAIGGKTLTHLDVTGSPDKQAGAGQFVVPRRTLSPQSSLSLPAYIGGQWPRSIS